MRYRHGARRLLREGVRALGERGELQRRPGRGGLAAGRHAAAGNSVAAADGWERFMENSLYIMGNEFGNDFLDIKRINGTWKTIDNIQHYY